jgi:hypothetical protein
MTPKTTIFANPKLLIMKLIIALAMAAIAVFFGMLASTANPLLIALGAGLIGGGMLLTMPRISVTLVLLVGLLMGALISIAGPQFSRLTWAISLLGLMLLIPSFLNLLSAKKRDTPAFIWLAIIFMAYAVISTLFNWDSITVFVASFKRYFQVFGLMLALGLLPLSNKDIQRWQYWLLIVALLQLPFALYELLILVPKRGGLALSSFTTDVVAGSFGANLEGGSPGSTMALFLLMVLGFVFSRWKSGLIHTSRFIFIALILLAPLGMGETKVVIVLLPMILIVLLWHDIKRSPLKFLPLLFLGFLLTAVLAYIYIVLLNNSSLAEVFGGLVDYNFGSAGYGDVYLNRTTVMSFWWSQQGLHDPTSFFFGNGIGSSYIGQGSGHIGLKYLHYGIDLTAVAGILWDFGIIGLLLFLAIFVSAWRAAGKLYRESKDTVVRADAIAIQAAISLFLLFVFYTSDIVTQISLEIIYAAVLGYLAYLCAEHKRNHSFLAAA